MGVAPRTAKATQTADVEFRETLLSNQFPRDKVVLGHLHKVRLRISAASTLTYSSNLKRALAFRGEADLVAQFHEARFKGWTRNLEIERAEAKTLQAIAITPQEMSILLQSAAPSQSVWCAAYVMYRTTSRFSDLTHLDLSDVVFVTPLTLRMRFRSWKGDSLGKKAHRKFIDLPPPRAAYLKDFINYRVQSGKTKLVDPEDYRRLNAWMKTVFPFSPRTTYSIRRGAITTLANLGYSCEDIIKITGHSSVDMLLRYIDPAPNQPLPRLQRRMTSDLEAVLF